MFIVLKLVFCVYVLISYTDCFFLLHVQSCFCLVGESSVVSQLILGCFFSWGGMVSLIDSEFCFLFLCCDCYLFIYFFLDGVFLCDLWWRFNWLPFLCGGFSLLYTFLHCFGAVWGCLVKVFFFLCSIEADHLGI